MTEEETFTSPGDFKKLIEDQKTLFDKKADEAEAKNRNMSAVGYRSRVIMCIDVLEKFKGVEQYINMLEEEIKCRDAAVIAEIDHELEQAEAEAMYEAEMEAEEQARAYAEAQAEYEASQCYYDGEY